MYDYILHNPKFRDVMRLWNKDGFRWCIEDDMLLIDFFAPEVDDSHDYEIAIDICDYGYTCFRPRDNWARMISQTEHKLITKTINVLKKLRKAKEVENAN